MTPSETMEWRNQEEFFELTEEAAVTPPEAEDEKQLSLDLSGYASKIRALTIAMIGLIAMPLLGLIAGDEMVWEKLQAVREEERAAKIQSSVLAVDTVGVSVSSKNGAAATKELFEQAAMEHLARLHHTYSSWSERHQELMGSVLLKLRVDTSGNVAHVEPVVSHVNNDSFVKTVMDDVRDWKFPKGGAETAEITVPLLFIPKGMNAELIVQWERKIRNGQRDLDAAKSFSLATALRATADQEKIPAAMTGPAALEVQEQKAVVLNTARPLATIANPTAITAPGSKAKTAVTPLAMVRANRQLAIRDNPRYSANSVRQVEEATALAILESHGDWLKVKTAQGGQVGFVRKEYVSPANG